MTPFIEHLIALAQRNNGVLTARELVNAAGYQKRGTNVINHIRDQLEANNIETSPDFASVGLDEPIEIVSKSKTTASPNANHEDHKDSIPEWQVQLEQISDRLARKEKAQATVRDILAWFDYSRRGAAIVSRISAALQEFDLSTNPDFRNAYIDEPLHFVATNTPSQDASTHSPGEDAAPHIAPPADEEHPQTPELITGGVRPDAIFRVGNLPTANISSTNSPGEALSKPHGHLVYVTIKDSIKKAMTLMRFHDVDQLPVFGVDGSGKKTVWTDVRGCVTWKHLCAYLEASKDLPLDLDNTDVRICMRKSIEVVDSSEDLLRTIPKILEHGFVLVRDKQRKITGIITAHDLSETLQSRMRPYILIEEIENHLRRILDGKVSKAEIAEHVQNANRVNIVSDLTFGGYITLLKVPAIWNRVGIGADQGEFIKVLEFARRTRNDIMHFAPDPLAPSDVLSLRRLAHFLRELVVHR